MSAYRFSLIVDNQGKTGCKLQQFVAAGQIFPISVVTEAREGWTENCKELEIKLFSNNLFISIENVFRMSPEKGFDCLTVYNYFEAPSAPVRCKEVVRAPYHHSRGILLKLHSSLLSRHLLT